MNLFAITLTPDQLGLYALLALLAIVAGHAVFGFFVKEDDKLIKARKTAQNIASFANTIALPIVADFFEDFAVNDIPGMLADAVKIVNITEDKRQRTLVVLDVVKQFISTAMAAGDTATIQQLQQMLGGTPQQAAQIAAQMPSAAQLQQLVAALNPNQIATGASGLQSSITQQLPTLSVSAPAVQTNVTHTLLTPATAANAAAPPATAAAGAI